MKCKEVQKRIDLELTRGSRDIGDALKSHIESCDNCGKYYQQAVRLGDLLSGQEFEVYPGELDDLTFEKITSSRQPVKKAGYFQNIFSIRWAWVPVAAAAIFIMFAVFPGKVNHNTQSGTMKIIDWNPPFSMYIPAELDSTALTGFVDSGNDLELLEDILINDSSVDNLIESLSDEEFDILNERLNAKSGSAG